MEQAAVRRMTASDSRLLREALLVRLENPEDEKVKRELPFAVVVKDLRKYRLRGENFSRLLRSWN